MKKICFITTISATSKAFVVDAAKYLYENGGYDITFICNTDIEFEEGLQDCFNYIPVPMKRGISLSGLRSVFKMFSIFKNEKFDLVQYSTPNASLYASIAAKLAGVPVRLYCQWGIVYVGFTGLKRRIFKVIEKSICRFSTWVEPDSYGNLNFSRSEGLYNDKKSSVVWNGSASGVSLKKFDITHKSEWRKEIRNKYNLDDDTFVIGFIGRITKDKGINELLSVSKKFFKFTPKSVLLLVGDNEKSETINDELYQWSVDEQRVFYCGRTNKVEKYLSAMDVFILPSYREGFGAVVIEAEAMGVTVIVTDIPGPTDAMIPNETGLVVKKGDEDSLLIALNTLAISSQSLIQMGLKGRSFIESNFDQEVLFQKILEDRRKLLE